MTTGRHLHIVIRLLITIGRRLHITTGHHLHITIGRLLHIVIRLHISLDNRIVQDNLSLDRIHLHTIIENLIVQDNRHHLEVL